MAEMTYLQAISDGLREEMRRDDAVFCLGEDIGAFGGAFKVTDGFLEEFGADRVLDTPLAENMIIGASIGAAIEGMRPVRRCSSRTSSPAGSTSSSTSPAKLHYRQGVSVPDGRAAAVRAAASPAGPSIRRIRKPGSSRRPGSRSWPPPRGRRQGPADQRDP